MASLSSASSLRSRAQPAAPAQDAACQADAVLHFAGLAAFVLVLAAGAVFVGAAAYVNYIDRGYRQDRGHLAVGASADAVLSHILHADRVSVEWKNEGSNSLTPGARYPYRGGVLDRPLNAQGRPLGLASCKLEYRLLGFYRKFVTLGFDEQGKVRLLRDGGVDCKSPQFSLGCFLTGS